MGARAQPQAGMLTEPRFPEEFYPVVEPSIEAVPEIEIVRKDTPGRIPGLVVGLQVAAEIARIAKVKIAAAERKLDFPADRKDRMLIVPVVPLERREHAGLQGQVPPADPAGEIRPDPAMEQIALGNAGRQFGPGIMIIIRIPAQRQPIRRGPAPGQQDLEALLAVITLLSHPVERRFHPETR